MEREISEVPQVDIPNEITEVNLPEIGESTPHPQTSDPQVRQNSGAVATNKSKIGFKL